ncbi:general substrate transporter [Atractiella rhizophila]|nr:general substrate transporter [Atractiella rhizophila]
MAVTTGLDDGEDLEGIEVPPEAEEDDETQNFTPFLLQLALTASLGGLLFGFDTGIISSSLVLLAKPGSLNGDSAALTSFEEELIVSSTTFAALFFALSAGRMADLYGRQRTILLSSILFNAGAVVQTVSHSVLVLVLGRAIVGGGVGLASMIIPVYLSEIAPKNVRGRLVTGLVVCITFGQVVSYLVGALFFNFPQGWRWMFAASLVPSLLQLVLTLSLPESPRFLILNDRLSSAREVLSHVYPGSPNMPDRVIAQVISSSRESSRQVSKWKLPPLRPLALSVSLQFFQQSTGFNTLMYFSTSLLASSIDGDTTTSIPAPILSLPVAISNFLCTFVSFRLVDGALGRRGTTLFSLAGMAIGMGVMALFWDAGLLGKVGGMIVYVSSYSVGMGNIPWIVQSEIFAYEDRATANSIATGVNWASNALVSMTFLELLRILGTRGTWTLYGGVCVLAFFCVFAQMPETRGLSVEEARKLFEDVKVAKRSEYERLPISAADAVDDEDL